MVGPEDSHTSACIDEDAAIGFVQGLLSASAVQRIDEHVDTCASCRMLLDEAVKAFRERSTAAQLEAPEAFTRFSPGEKLDGRYQIVRFIARGGMGEVYEAEDLILNARIAVKTVTATISDNPQAIRRLKQEVNLARRITHPNVCRIFDLGVHEPPGQRPGQGVFFITMELIPGQSLGQRLRGKGPLSPAEAGPIAQALVAALGAAHRAGIVHRDFKSDNVMLSPDPAGGPPRVVVMDFGLARRTSSALPAQSTSLEGRSLAGTLAYMSPEQLQGKPIRPATDIYALGIVLYEMLTGQLPFQGDSAIEAAWKRLTEPAPSPRSLAPAIDDRWESVILRCLEREPGHRFAQAEDVATVLAAPAPENAPASRSASSTSNANATTNVNASVSANPSGGASARSVDELLGQVRPSGGRRRGVLIAAGAVGATAAAVALGVRITRRGGSADTARTSVEASAANVARGGPHAARPAEQRAPARELAAQAQTSAGAKPDAAALTGNTTAAAVTNPQVRPNGPIARAGQDRREPVRPRVDQRALVGTTAAGPRAPSGDGGGRSEAREPAALPAANAEGSGAHRRSADPEEGFIR